jgi:thiol-disulfide isomerase/thioredoxin
MGIVLPAALLIGQDKKTLAIGERVPQLSFSNVINHKLSTLRFSDYSGKVLVLDFWSTFCAPCIEAFPKYDSLQKMYGDKLQVILVTYEDHALIKKLWAKHPSTKNLSLPCITGDTALHKLFDVTLVPQIVWVDKAGTVAAYTDGDYLNKQKIQDIIEGSTAEWVQNKKKGEFDYSRAFLTGNKNLPDAAKIYYSCMTGYLPGLKTYSGITRDTANSLIRLYTINKPLQVLALNVMKMAGKPLHPSQILLRLKDSAKYVADRTELYTDRMAKTSITYEAILPLSSSDERIRESFLDDLNRYLGLYARFEKFDMPCYVLKKTNKEAKPAVHPDDPVLPIADYLTIWMGRGKVLIINESGYEAKLQFPFLQTLEEIQEKLVNHGFSLQPETRLLDVLVISDTKF